MKIALPWPPLPGQKHKHNVYVHWTEKKPKPTRPYVFLLAVSQYLGARFPTAGLRYFFSLPVYTLPYPLHTPSPFFRLPPSPNTHYLFPPYSFNDSLFPSWLVPSLVYVIALLERRIGLFLKISVGEGLFFGSAFLSNDASPTSSFALEGCARSSCFSSTTLSRREHGYCQSLLGH